MNTYRIATVHVNVDISMTAWMFWFFKRFAKVTTSKPRESGLPFDYVFFDEAKP